MDAPSYVFKLKYNRTPGALPLKEETRRYGFAGDLRQEQVYAGLYDRTSQVFSLAPSSFYLTFSPPALPHSPFESTVALEDYATFVSKVCDTTLGNLDAVKRDEKKRIVLVFGVELVKPGDVTGPVFPSSSSSTSASAATSKFSATARRATLPATAMTTRSLGGNTSWEKDIESGFSIHNFPDVPQSVLPPFDFPRSSAAPPTTPPTATATSTASPAPTVHRPFLSQLQGPRKPPFSTLFAPPPLPIPQPLQQEKRNEPTWGSPEEEKLTLLRTKQHMHAMAQASGHQPRRLPFMRQNDFYLPLTPPPVPLASIIPPPPASKACAVPAAVEKKTESTLKSFKDGDAAAQLVNASGYHPSYPAVRQEASEYKGEGEKAPFVPAGVVKREASVSTANEVVQPAEATSATTDGWTGVKTLLKTFVKDFNRHMEENFGDDVGRFELNMREEEDVKVKVEEEEEAKVIHVTCWCDKCLKIIVGPRHKCLSCANYDLCASCLPERAEFHEADHVFGTIKKPGDRPVRESTAGSPAQSPSSRVRGGKKCHPHGHAHGHGHGHGRRREEKKVMDEKAEKVEGQDVEHPATCDICDKTIKGIRHKCINCPDWDVCTACLPRVSTLHPLHNFLPITSPVTTLRSQPGDRQIHHNVSCDGCSASPIMGIRYKCTHEACQDSHVGGFDLCANCEADPIPRHPRDHVMLKIRYSSEGLDGASAARAFVGKRMEEVVRRAKRFNPAMMGRKSSEEGDQGEGTSQQLGNGIANLLASLGVGSPHTATANATISTRSTSTSTSPVHMSDRSVGTTSPSDLPTTVRFIPGEGAEKGQDVLVVDLDVSQLSREEKQRLPETIYVPISIPPQQGSDDSKAPEPFNEPYDVEQLVSAAEAEHESEKVDEDVPKEFEQTERLHDAELPVAIPSPQLELDGEFLNDITLKDGSLVPAGGLFVKIWQVKNTGQFDWPVGTKLVNIGGFSKLPLGHQVELVDVPLAKVNEIVELACELKAPEDDGRHMDHWRLSAPNGEMFGDRLWVDITVESDEEALRNSGSSLSSSIVAPSITTPGGNFQTAPSVSATTDHSLPQSEFESVQAEESDSEHHSAPSEADSEEDEQDSETEFVVLSGSDDIDSDSDEEWSAAA